MKFRTTIRKKAASTAIALLLAVGATMAGPSGARAGADPFLGEIMLFAGTFCPVGYLECNGALVPIAQNSALFAILGTTYGGDGQTTLPCLTCAAGCLSATAQAPIFLLAPSGSPAALKTKP